MRGTDAARVARVTDGGGLRGRGRNRSLGLACLDGRRLFSWLNLKPWR